MDLNILLGITGDIFSTLEDATKKLVTELHKDFNGKVAEPLQDSPKQDLVTRASFIEKFNISPTTLWNWQNKGWVNPIRLCRRVFFDLNEVKSNAALKKAIGKDWTRL